VITNQMIRVRRECPGVAIGVVSAGCRGRYQVGIGVGIEVVQAGRSPWWSTVSRCVGRVSATYRSARPRVESAITPPADHGDGVVLQALRLLDGEHLDPPGEFRGGRETGPHRRRQSGRE
jgi:hypothetical protein